MTPVLDPYQGIFALVLVALVIGLVVFGGTTLTYFLGKRRQEPPNRGPVQRVQQRSELARALDDRDARHDLAA